MQKEILELNKFTYLNDEKVYVDEKYEILDILSKLKDSGVLEIISIMKHKLTEEQSKRFKKMKEKEYYSYHHFEILLKDVELTKIAILNKIKAMYLNCELDTEGESVSGSKIEILRELTKEFNLYGIIKDKLTLTIDEFEYIHLSNIYSDNKAEVLGFIVKPLNDEGDVEVLTMMKNKVEDKQSYSYHHFKTTLKNIDIERRTTFNQLRKMYVDGTIKTEDKNFNGEKLEIVKELTSKFSLDRNKVLAILSDNLQVYRM